MNCSLCPHESCLYSKTQNTVEKCEECEHGVMVLEPHWQTGGPAQKWKIACNSPKYVYHISTPYIVMLFEWSLKTEM